MSNKTDPETTKRIWGAAKKADFVDRLPLVSERTGRVYTGVECSKCGKPEGVEGVCPFQLEINDEEVGCLCCPDCRYECAMDI